MITEATRDVLAWEAIEDDADTRKQLDEAGERLLKRNAGRAKSDLNESIWRAYRYLYLLGKDNKLRQIDLGQITSSMAGSLAELYVNELSRTDEITAGVGANKLLKYWPPALTEWSTKGCNALLALMPKNLKRNLSGVSDRRILRSDCETEETKKRTNGPPNISSRLPPRRTPGSNRDIPAANAPASSAREVRCVTHQQQYYPKTV